MTRPHPTILHPILRRTAIAVSTALLLAGAPLLSAPVAQAAPLPIDTPIFCPPNIAQIGVPFTPSTGVYDEDGGTYTVSISGALPPGLALVDRKGLAPIVSGTPTRLGSSTFTITLLDNFAQTKQKICFMDVVPAGSKLERIGATDRYAEAVDIANRILTAGADPVVYLASGENFADALSASGLASQHGGVVLLSTRDTLPPSTAEYLTRRAPSNVVVVGSENTLSAALVAQVKAASATSTITRIGGTDRYETSRMLISDATLGAMASTELFVASGTKFPDALSASPAAASLRAPVLLVDGHAQALSAAEEALVTARGVKRVTVVGGEDTVSRGLNDSLADTAGASSRIDGVDRYAVSAHTVARHFPATSPSDTVYLATGANFPDALAGGALAGKNHAPILLVSKNCMTSEVAAEITRLKPDHLVLLGGPDTLDATLGTLPLCS
ncbi:cell wall-binding repeat-containing protein [Herbiconiux sp. A18JL235]|uniref:Cell wall-binding repeat-containing protein n=1 Tax=Herbiconiux sp. A18JL235 TaxID=3152363 RepID=A0AB39BBS6_9MICO